jgi:hypothetical protein
VSAPAPRIAALALVLAVVAAMPARAAIITIVNADTAGEGFNDPTAVAPVGGNPGTTRGAQRLNVFQQAAAIWGAILPSTVTIRVQASFDPLTCSSTSGVLGSAGAQTVHRNFGGAEFANTWYPQSLANKEAGVDLSGFDDIRARFNKDVDNSACLGTTNWYYGYDGNEGSNVDLLPVVLHELGHGLGFLTNVTLSNGQQFSGSPDVFERFLFDNSTGKSWLAMSDAERQASAINLGHVVWTGTAANLHAANTLAKRSLVGVSAPAAIAGVYDGGHATFGATLTTSGVTAGVVLANDGSGTASDACTALINGAAMNGKIALVDAGNCTSVTKATRVQAAGAVGMIVVSNVAGSPPDLTGTAPAITIPLTSVSQADGTTIRNQLGAGVVATIGIDNTRLAGADDSGRLRLYAPNPLQGGSSISHFDVVAFPNLLMEPVINSDLSGVDLTRYAFEDIGWLPRTTDTVGAGPAIAVLSSAPNPFSTATTIRLDLTRSGMTRLSIYDVGGRLVRTLENAWLPAGQYTLAWDGADDHGDAVRPGVYLSQLKIADTVLSKRLVRVD